MGRGILRPSFGLLLVGLLALALLVIGVQPAAAQATLVVDEDGMATAADCDATDPAYTTISAAVAAASAGDTIQVCPGIYNESVTINKNNLTLLGAKAGVPAGPAAMPAGRGTDESVVNGLTAGWVIRSDATGTTINGFTLNSNPAVTGQHAVSISARSPDATVVNNIMVGGAVSPTGNASGIQTASFSDHLLAHNNIRGFRYGIQADGAPTDAQTAVDSNYMTANILYGFFAFGSVSNGHVIADNVMELNRAGILVAQGEHQITGNTIRDNVSSAIILFGTERTFGVQITENDLLNNGSVGIFLAVDHASAVDNEAHQNNIAGNAFGVYNQHSALFDATCNWWGSPSGPFNADDNPTGTGNPVVEDPGEVEFKPWLIDPAPDGECIGQPLPAAGKATGGGQIDVGSRASFGFNAKLEEGETTGHLTYRNHASGAHLNCTVTEFLVLTPTTATFSGTCSSQSSANSFTAEVEDNGEPGRGVDRFVISYDGVTEGDTLTNGNIQIQVEPAAEPASAQSSDSGTTGAGEGDFASGATFSGIALSGLELGTGISIGSDGTATGRFAAVLLGTSLLGQPQEISVDGKVGSGSIGPDGSATFSGSATVDLGDGSLPLLEVPFDVTATTESLLLTLGTSALPSASLPEGSITIE